MKRELVLILFVAFAVLFRIIPHPPNFAPITALALFSGVTFSNRLIGILVPLTAMVISDFFLGFSSITLWVYAGFIGINFLGSYLKQINLKSIFLSSCIFFVVSNFGVWLLGYPLTLEGFILCFTMAIPFFGYSIAGDLFYSLVLKYSFKYTENKWLTTAY